MLRSDLPFCMVPFTSNDLNLVKPEVRYYVSLPRTKKSSEHKSSACHGPARLLLVQRCFYYGSSLEIICFTPNFIPKVTHTAGTTSFAQISHEMDNIKKFITSIGESDTTDQLFCEANQLFCEAETYHGPTWLVRTHVKPAKKKEKKYYCI